MSSYRTLKDQMARKFQIAVSREVPDQRSALSGKIQAAGDRQFTATACRAVPAIHRNRFPSPECPTAPEPRTPSVKLCQVILSKWLALLLSATATLGAQDLFQFHGYIQGRFTNQQGTPDRLEIRRARVVLSGDPLSKLSYTFQIDAVKRPFLLDAALTWKFSRSLRITAGQFKIPFSTESLIADNVNIPISRARAVNALSPGRDTGVQGRDLGLQLAGTLQRSRPLIDYMVGVFRGQTLADAAPVHYPASAARIMAHPLPGVQLGADWYSSFSAPAGAQKRRHEAEGSYQHGPIQFRAEEIWARDGALHRRGGYFLAAWRLSSYWEPLARADWLTSDTHKANSGSVAYVLGVNFYWMKHVKFSANAGAQHDQGSTGTTSIFLAQTMVGF
jgi:phosphate-selective porin OprO and OprP